MSNRIRKTLILMVLIVAMPTGGLAIMSLFSRKPANLGVSGGRLAGCPDSPNCVSTQASDPAHRMEPMPLAGSAEDAIARLRGILTAMPRSRIVADRENYLHAEFRSALFRFVDDVEFLVDSEARVIHFRSASRVGHSDLGVNRRRMEEIRAAFTSG